MKNIRLLLFSALAGLALLSSCSQEDLHNTSTPDQGTLRLVTDWGTGVAANLPYVVSYGPENSEELVVKDANSLIYDIKGLEPGRYRLELYSKATDDAGFSRDGDVIEVVEDPADPGFIYANPKVFFSARTSTTVYADRVNTLTVPLYPQMRKLVIRVYLRNDPVIYTWENPGGGFRELLDIKATLTGVANRFDFIADSYSGNNTIRLPFRVRQDDDTERYLEATVTVVGFTKEEVQNFDLSFRFRYGEQIPDTKYNFHDDLFSEENNKNFNDYNQKRINDTILKQIVLPLTPNGKAEITDYEPVVPEDTIKVDEDTYKYKIGDLYPKDTEAKQGIVVWVAADPGSDEGSHGLVMSREQNDTLAWGQVADLPQLDDKGNVQKDSYNYIKFATESPVGEIDTDGIGDYLNKNQNGHTELDYEAYGWIRGSEAKFTANWFLPSKVELEFLGAIPDLDTKLAAAGMPVIGDKILWSSQTESVLKPDSVWRDPETPEYDEAWVFVWNPSTKQIEKSRVGEPNPNYDPDWEPAPDDPEGTTNPEKPVIPYEKSVRAFRYF